MAWTGLGLSAASAVAVALPVSPALKCLVLVAFASFGPGAALVCHVRLGSVVASWAMALVTSLSTVALSAALMVWTHWWHPGWMLVGLCVPSIASTVGCLAQLGRTAQTDSAGVPVAGARDPMEGRPRPRRAPAGTTLNPPAPSLAGRPVGVGTAVGRALVTVAAPDRYAYPIMPSWLDSIAVISRVVYPDPAAAVPPVDVPEPAIVRALRSWWTSRVPRGQLAILVAAAGCWLAAVPLSGTGGVGDYGLLSAVHPAFFVAVALCVLGFVLEVGRGAHRGWLLLAYLLLLLLILHATVPLLVQEPEYAWTYKHIGVIELFRSRGRVLNPTDIYQAWPALFAGVAQLVALSGASTLKITAWAPLYFDAANCLPLFAIVRTLTGDRRLPWLTVFLFSCLNWVRQDYLSPQAFTFVLCLGAALIMLRWLRRVPGPTDVRPRWLGRLWGSVHQGLADVPYPTRRVGQTALVCLYFVYTVVVISHQLSPYIVALSAGALVLLGLVRYWQIVPILLGIAVLYLLPRYSTVDRYGGLFDGGLNIFGTFLHSTEGVSPPTSTSSAGRIFTAQAVQLLSVVVWGTAALAVLTARKRLGPVAAPAVLAFAPFAVMFGQRYGGEAIYRVFLFSLPWCSYLIGTLFLRVGLHRVPPVAKALVATVAVGAGTLVGVQGAQGQLSFDQFTPAEVRSMEYLYAVVPSNAMILAAADNSPARLTANYGDFKGYGDPQSLTTVFPALGPTIGPSDMASIRAYCAQFDGPVYLVYMDSMVRYLHYFGYAPDGTLQSLRAALDTSPDWSVLYRDGDTVIYRFGAPGPSRGTAPDAPVRGRHGGVAPPS
jgi:hypothetical protein